MRIIRIKKNVLGEEYSFFITVQPNTFKCSYTIHFKSGNPLGATITEDFGHIVLDEPIKLDGYINGLNPPTKMVSKIKIPKDRKFNFKEEITGSY